MDKATLPGVVLGFAALLIAVVWEGGELTSLLHGAAALIVFGGTLGAALVAFPFDTVARMPKLLARAFTDKAEDASEVVETFVGLADKARREGLLALEHEAQDLDPFTRKGVLAVVDGSDTETVREIMEADIDAMRRRHKTGYALFESMGGYSPTMGIIGTVMGLVNVLGHLESPSELGHLIAGAFIATLYGVAIANLLWLPLGGKLKHKSEEEVAHRELVIEGIMAVQAGDNPRVVREKLEAHLPPDQRGVAERGDTAAPIRRAA